MILVAGSQKIVPDLETALKRIRAEHVQPWEEAQVRKTANMGTFVGKILIIERGMGQRADDRNTREGTNRILRKSSRFTL